MICGGREVVRFDLEPRQPSGSNNLSLLRSKMAFPNGDNRLLQRHSDLDLLDENFAGFCLGSFDEGN
jgi:hypothetical protein